MVTPDEDNDHYLKDPRTPCKYGNSCYQKNPLHHEKYKHPPKKRFLEQDEDQARSKKLKLDNRDQSKSSDVNISNDISDVCNDLEEEKPLQESIIRTPVTFNRKEFIKEKFLLEMPGDFYSFWDFCKTLNKDNPYDAFTSVGLNLVGPYDVLADKFSNVPEKSPETYLIHWRYYHDPPEFQTVIKGCDSTGYHIGYFRDDPKQLPAFVASNHANKDGEFVIMGENIFAAVSDYLESKIKCCNPFQKLSYNKLHVALKKCAAELKLDLSRNTTKIKERKRKILVHTFNTLGLVVPYDKKTQLGYRRLCVSNSELKKLLDRIVKTSPEEKNKVMADLQPILTATSIAVDECDFGTGIELGWNILSHQVDSLNCTIESFLASNYRLLQRSEFAKIISAHMKDRKKGFKLSIV